MNYLELMAAYNLQKKKLLIEPTLSHNLGKLPPVDQGTFFLDIRFFNPRLTFKENMEIKKYQAQLLHKEGHLMYFGDIYNNILYQRAELDGARLTTFLPGGLTENSDAFVRKFHFHNNHYVVKTYCGGKLFMVQNLSYNILAEKLTHVLHQYGARFGKSFYEVRAYNSGATAQFIARKKIVEDTEILTILEKAGITVNVLLNAPSCDTAVLQVR